MADIYLDFETRSSIPIEHGVRNYLTSPHSAIVCLGYKIGSEPTRIWRPGQPIPFEVHPQDRIHAFNALFDFQVWHVLGAKHGFPKPDLSQWHCAMALAGRYTLFQSLEMACKVLNIGQQKLAKLGKALIKKICIPPFEYTTEDLKQFYVYCIRDVDAMYDLIHGLPTPMLSNLEHDIWLVTMKMNLRGIPVDSFAVNRIYKTLQMFIETESKKIPKLTNFQIQKATQNVAIVKWAYSMGVELPNLTVTTVAKFIKKLEGAQEGSNHWRVLEVLKLRQKLALTSTAKYKKLLELDHHGRIYENLRYHGAATGRWAGLNAQLHNLPRAKVDDPDAEIEKFYDRTILTEDPLASAKALIRPMIRTQYGDKLVVLDYAAIENRILMWLCREHTAIEMIVKGYDQYKMMASELFGVPYDNVNGDQRFVGKTLILGAGYNLGGKGYKAYAAGYGIELTNDEAEVAIQKYRARYRNVVKYWYGAKDTMIHAIQYQGFPSTFGGCEYVVQRDHKGHSWLVLKLPSGRALFYNEPSVKDDKFGLVPTHMGINSYTRKWDRLKLIPGRIIENIVQALARDVLADAKLRIDKAGYKLILSVHDEIVIECKDSESENVFSNVSDMMRVPPPWGNGQVKIPLDVDGFITIRYKK